MSVLWRIDPLLDKHFETNETTAVSIQKGGKHACTTIQLLLEKPLCNPLLGSCNCWTKTIEMGVCSTWSVPRSYLEDNWGVPRGISKLTRIRLGGSTSLVVVDRLSLASH
jgi:hypothetical protein